MVDILVTAALTRRFGDVVAVDALDLAVVEGEVFGLLGRNGAGKTTLIKMLTTLLPPSDGSATVGGFDVAREAARVRAIIGYVPQAISADGELSGRENLEIFAQPALLSKGCISAEAERAMFVARRRSGVGHAVLRTRPGCAPHAMNLSEHVLHRTKRLMSAAIDAHQQAADEIGVIA